MIQKLKASEGLYYDLIRVPSGHIPVTKLRFWRSLSIPLLQFRDSTYFKCNEHKTASFYKNGCMFCQMSGKFLKKENWRNFKKFLESMILPVLVWRGKAWYVRTTKRTTKDKKIHLNYEQVRKRIKEINPSVNTCSMTGVSGNFACRKEVLIGLFSDEKWAKEFHEAKSPEEVRKVIEDYCKEKNIRVMKLEE